METKNLGQRIRHFCEQTEGFCLQDISKFFDAIKHNELLETESGREYRILSDEDCLEAVSEYIEDSVWAFRPEFLAWETDVDQVVFEKLSELYEEGNEAILAIIRQTCGFESFVTSAVSTDGFGPFLAHYDHEELEIPGTDLYLFRVN